MKLPVWLRELFGMEGPSDADVVVDGHCFHGEFRPADEFHSDTWWRFCCHCGLDQKWEDVPAPIRAPGHGRAIISSSMGWLPAHPPCVNQELNP